jgi:hypothetical protein
MAAEVRTFRRSADETLKELTAKFQKGDYEGVLVGWMDKDGNGHFRIVGFDDGQIFAAAGLAHWIVTGLLKDIG